MEHVHHALPHSWSTPYIALSFVIAALASYLSLEVASRAGPRPTATGNRKWLVAQAFGLGYGIWAMHFVGMLAFQVSAAVSYNLLLTILSGVAAVGLMYVALLILHGGSLKFPRLLSAGALAGSGIVVMHYLGMYAFQVRGTAVSIAWVPFAGSVLIAVGASMVAFYLFRVVSSNWSRRQTPLTLTGLKVAAGLVMGVAIVSMHYTGMAAWQHQVVDSRMLYSSVGGADTDGLAVILSVMSILLFSLTISALAMDAMLVPQSREKTSLP